MKDELKNKSAQGTHNSALASGEAAKGQFLVYQAEDGKLKLDVRFEDESVWLSQGLMAELFQKDVRTISEHIQNIYEEGELIPEATIRKFRIVRMEGKRQVARMVDFYNLDMIISVGYRVKSHVATRFRIWATKQLTEFIKKGFLLDDERLKNPDLPFDYFEVFVSIGVHSWLKTGDSKNDKFQYA
ncbi:virulence RhuM family protein [Desulfotignum balticum]|uniref:virulence RhuM family protein n=1 Tax=Desulfotignum balticum TaxID=115781 RepID=UPI0009FF5DA8|nr:RhuM family protein [Desulfotignum balticum]